MQNIGIQLFSLPFLLDKDFRTGIELLSELGYKELEFYGPYPFSDQVAIDNWEAVTPALGFSGSGFFGQTAKEVKSILGEYEMAAPATHVDLATLQNKMGELGEAADLIGFEYAGIAMIPEHLRENLDDYKRMAELFNHIGEDAKRNGLKFSYHNHGYGLKEMDGQIPLNLLLQETDPDLVHFEMDIFWTTAGGANPIDYLQHFKNRYHLMHVKDMREHHTFSGDGGNADQWMELYPHMTTAGDGVLDIAEIVNIAKANGVKHFFVEQDMVSEPEIALKKSFDYLAHL
jgi:sugar phosphate isomerase/epimerase